MISLDDPIPFLDDCKRRIAPIIRVEGIGFNKPRRAPATKNIWELNGYHQSQAETPKEVFRVLPLLGTRLHEFWLSTQLAFVFSSGAYELNWISMTVFEGERSDQVKNPLLRAEWAETDSSQRADHAQPHWHVYGRRERLMQQGGGVERWNFDEDSAAHGGEEEPSQIPMTAFNLARFHFAMASQWQDSGRGVHLQAFAEEKVLSWLDGCLSYIVDQLEYIDG